MNNMADSRSELKEEHPKSKTKNSQPRIKTYVERTFQESA